MQDLNLAKFKKGELIFSNWNRPYVKRNDCILVLNCGFRFNLILYKCYIVNTGKFIDLFQNELNDIVNIGYVMT